MASEFDVGDEFGWAEADVFAGSSQAHGGSPVTSSGEPDWAGIVGSVFGGTAAIITAVQGGATPPPSAPVTVDPFGGAKASPGPPMWVWGAVALGGFLLLTRRNR